jgi:hypothetical protein
MKKVRKIKMTWDVLLKMEEKHPFSAGNPTSLNSLTSFKLKKQGSSSKKLHSHRRELMPA